MPSLGAQRVEDLRASGVPGGEVAERAFALVLVLDSVRFAGACRAGRGDPFAGLDRGLLIGAHDVVAGVQALALPEALVEIEDRSGALGETLIAREDPGALLPGLDRVGREPAPDGHAADLLDDPARDHLARELGR
jgi:hypothetical protein